MSEEISKFIQSREENFPDGLLKAKELLEAQIKEDSNNAKAYLQLSEVLFWLGDYSENKDDKNKFFEEGVAAGKIAVEKNPDSAAAHMWYASNMGQHGLIQGIMKSAMYMGPIEKHGKKSMDIDENYFDGGPLRLLGRFYHQAPGFPIGPGNNSKSLKMLEKAVEKGPNFAYNHLYLADLLISKSKKKEARLLLEKIKSMSAPAGMEKLHARVQKEAGEMMSKV